MESKMKKITNTFAALLMLTALVALPFPVSAQNLRTTDLKVQPFNITLEPKQVQVNKRTPLPFKPFEMVDLDTGKPISPDTLITLPDGKRVKARDYYNELNRLEPEFNALGYSLRDTKEAKVELQKPLIDVAVLNQQAREIKASVLPNTRFRPVTRQTLQELQQESQRPNSMLGTTIEMPPPKPKVANWSSNYDKTIGNSTFSAHLNGQIELLGTDKLTSVSGRLIADASAFGHSFDLLQVYAGASLGNADMLVKAFGNVVYSNNVQGIMKDSYSKPFDSNFNLNLPLGPLNLKVTLGVRGDIGVDYMLVTVPNGAGAQIGPFIHSSVYAQAAVGGNFAGASAEANLTLVNAQADLEGGISLGPDANKKPCFKAHNSLSLNANLLSGYVKFSAHLYKKTWEWTPISWSGLQLNGMVFNNTYSLPLY
jgi:hypothetical protein